MRSDKSVSQFLRFVLSSALASSIIHHTNASLSTRGQAVVREFVYGLSSIKDRIVVQYILTLLHAALTADPSIAELFWKLYVMSTEVQPQDHPAEQPRIAGEENELQKSPIAGPFKPLMQMVLDDMNQYNVETAAECLIILFGFVHPSSLGLFFLYSLLHLQSPMH